MDLYDDANLLTGRLAGDLPLTTFSELRGRDLSADTIRWRTEKGRLHRPVHGLYSPASRATGRPDLLDRIHAALAVSPPLALVSHQTAALLQGFGVAPDSVRAIHLTVPAGTPFPQRKEIAAHQTVIPICQPVAVLGIPCTPPRGRASTWLVASDGWMPCQCWTRPFAVVPLPSKICCLSYRKHDGLRGVRQARALVLLADPRPECRQESQLQLRLHDASLYGFVPQLKVLDDDWREACRIDLGEEETKVGLEYDGMSHYNRERARSDRHRHNWLASRGWTMRYFTDRDLYHRPDQLIQTARLAQSVARPVEPRR